MTAPKPAAGGGSPTPGPWTPDKEPSRVVNPRAGMIYVRDKCGGVVAGAFVGGGRTEANARLIASAPQLAEDVARLRADLRAALDRFDLDYYQEQGEPESEACRMAPSRLADVIRAALGRKP